MDSRGYLLNELAVSLGIMAIIALSLGGAVVLSIRTQVESSQQKVIQEEAYSLQAHLLDRLAAVGSGGEMVAAADTSIEIRVENEVINIYYSEGAVYERVTSPSPSGPLKLMGNVKGLRFHFYDRAGNALVTPVQLVPEIGRVDFDLTVDSDGDGGTDYEIRGGRAIKTPQRGS